MDRIIKSFREDSDGTSFDREYEAQRNARWIAVDLAARNPCKVIRAPQAPSALAAQDAGNFDGFEVTFTAGQLVTSGRITLAGSKGIPVRWAHLS